MIAFLASCTRHSRCFGCSYINSDSAFRILSLIKNACLLPQSIHRFYFKFNTTKVQYILSIIAYMDSSEKLNLHIWVEDICMHTGCCSQFCNRTLFMIKCLQEYIWWFLIQDFISLDIGVPLYSKHVLLWSFHMVIGVILLHFLVHYPHFKLHGLSNIYLLFSTLSISKWFSWTNLFSAKSDLFDKWKKKDDFLHQ